EAVKEALIESGKLTAVWVALGGVAAEALGLNATEFERTKAKIKELEEEAASYRKTIELGPKALSDGIYDRAPITQARNELEKLNVEIRFYKELLDGLAGKYDDQVSRAQRQGRGIARGIDSGLDARHRSAM